jgi:hypothetical protein
MQHPRACRLFSEQLIGGRVHPSWGLAARQAASFFALLSNLSVSNTGGVVLVPLVAVEPRQHETDRALVTLQMLARRRREINLLRPDHAGEKNARAEEQGEHFS